jgi:pilus assembly protein CpaF
MKSEDWLCLSQKSQVKGQTGTMSLISYDQCIEDAMNFESVQLNEQSSALITDDLEYEKQVDRNIMKYIETKHPKVEGFINNSQMDYTRLRQAIHSYMLDYGIITPATQDPNINEIRINQPDSVRIERKGRSFILRDLLSQPVVFSSSDEVYKLANKLLYASHQSVSRSMAHSIVRGSTAEGWRVTVTGPAAISPEVQGTRDYERCPSIVIRKHPDKVYTVEDYIRFRSLTVQMANFIRLAVFLRYTVVVVGATGAGKTGTLQMLLDAIRGDLRTIIIESLSNELRGSKNSDYVHWIAYPEPINKEDLTAGYPTFSNLFTQSMTQSPSAEVFGELKEDLEFILALKAINTGHQFLGTYHSGDTVDAIERWTTAIMSSAPNMNKADVMYQVCNNVDFVLYQELMDDGIRRILNIDEVIGIDISSGVVKPVLKPIFEYVCDGTGLHDGLLRGEFLQINQISERHSAKLRNSGLSKDALHAFTQQASQDKPLSGDFDIDGILNLNNLLEILRQA